MYLYLKRFLDIILSFLLIIPLSVVFLIIGIGIKLEDRGPVFYCGKRLGKNEKIFKMYKFRSMKINAPDIRRQDGTTFNSKDDPRVTRIGKFIRESSIDEIPQVINVIKGDMSFVGPRASLVTALGTYENNEKGKVLVRPGITGYTQAYYRNNIGLREKRLKDAWYANNISIMLDIKILLKTVGTVFKREGIYVDKLKDNGSEKH